MSPDNMLRRPHACAVSERLIGDEVGTRLVLGAEHHMWHILEQIGHGSQNFHGTILVRIGCLGGAYRTYTAGIGWR